jgi:uncharacterized protein (DUF1015 family)
MVDVIPFCGIRYKSKNISELICPPYDVISPAEKEKLLSASTYNAVRLELPEDYKKTRQLFDSWLRHGVLKKDTSPAFYFYAQSFKSGGKDYTRCGFLALLKTERLGKNVFGHEKTHTAPKADRLRLLKNTRINTSPIFCLFDDSGGDFAKSFSKVEPRLPDAYADNGKDKEKMWAVHDGKIIAALSAYIRNEKIMIADGHHRYESFYRFTRGGYILAFLCPFESKGLVILPTHRILPEAGTDDFRMLFKLFKVLPVPSMRAPRLGEVLLFAGGRFYRLIPNRKTGDVLRYLHSEVLKDRPLVYEKDAHMAVEMAGTKGMAFILRPTAKQDLKKIMAAGGILPQKSTYFYPKVSTGIVFNELP